jgi:hypothetical protein
MEVAGAAFYSPAISPSRDASTVLALEAQQPRGIPKQQQREIDRDPSKRDPIVRVAAA